MVEGKATEAANGDRRGGVEIGGECCSARLMATRRRVFGKCPGTACPRGAHSTYAGPVACSFAPLFVEINSNGTAVCAAYVAHGIEREAHAAGDTPGGVAKSATRVFPACVRIQVSRASRWLAGQSRRLVA